MPSLPSSLVLPAVLLLCGLRHALAFNVLESGAFVFQAPADVRAPGDYFGYTVSLATLQSSNWLVVSAPRAQSQFEKKYTRPGAIFRCPPTGGNCQALRLIQGISQSGEENTMHISNGSLGGSMDAVLGQEGMVVCNPAYKNLGSADIKMPGLCYWVDVEHTYGRSERWISPNYDLPGNMLDPEEKKGGDLGTQEFGFSVHKLQDGQSSLIGGPGFFRGRGSVSQYLFNTSPFVEKKTVGVAVPPLKRYDYFGYSVTSGRFQRTKKLMYVGGAPRAEYLQGKVIVFNYTDQPGRERLDFVKIMRELNGSQIGEYYGATLAVADINGDEVDDLLVGAPLHKVAIGDEGMVYLYLTSGKNENGLLDVQEKVVPKTKISNARFGTSIASLGDIDKDGYTDIAIGAPYEDSERGTIYIYYGSSESPYLKYEQRIRAQDINNNLKGFGFSFSHGGDIDSNTYNDFAVGAYLSDQALMFRTSPVLRFNSSVNIDKDKIPMFSDRIPLTICVRPNELLADTVVEVSINIDQFHNRGSIDGKKLIKHLVNMTSGNLKDECWTRELRLKNNTKVFKPLEIELSYEILFPKQTRGEFCKTCPVLDIKNPKTTHNVYYQTGCEGNICKTDFVLTGNFTDVGSPFTIGKESNIEMVVQVANLLEPSYETNISIIFPSGVQLRQTHRSCFKSKYNSSDLTKLLCEVPYILSKNSKNFSFSLQFDMDSVPWDISQLQVNLSVEGSGKDQNISNDKLTLALELLHIADINIKGRSVPESLSYVFKHNDSDDYDYQDRTFEHIYTVMNNGPSPVYGLMLKFEIPHSIKVGEINITYLHVESVARHPQRIETSKSDDEIDHKSGVSEKNRDANYLTLDCALPDVKCQVIHYNITQTLHAKQGETIQFKFKGLFKEQGPLLKYSGVRVLSSGVIQNEFLLDQDLPDKTSFAANAETLLYGNVLPKDGVQDWIIIVAVICGILILIILCVILWKLGFFKRNKPPSPEDEEPEKPDTGTKEDTDLLCENGT